ncbi:DUF6387 family protein [Providencia sp. PROV144]|uniref:DUF6387 family protein n=1 Tax=Providencia sp. PROV144 TaxID=2949854 RepID=UPI00234BDB7C|nr:DUF6387 family protein [Providencia sp. PROV144]
MAKATKKDLSWFNLSNYSFLYGLTLKGLIEELEYRELLFRISDSNDDLDYYEYEIKFKRIFSGDPNISVLNDEERREEDEYNRMQEDGGSLRSIYGELPKLKSGEGVHPVTFAELSMYSFSAIDSGFFKRDEDYVYMKIEASLSSVTGNLDCLSNSVLTSIWLDDSTDEEIIASITKLLPLWRKQLSIPEKEHLSQKRIGVKTLQKLITNRVIPLLDLLLWGKVSNKEITNPMIGLLVFNDDPKDTQAIKESIKPFSLEAMSDKYTRLLKLYINRDPEIGSCKISDLMSRDS